MESDATGPIEKRLNADVDAAAAAIAAGRPWEGAVDSDKMLDILGTNVYEAAYLDFATAAYNAVESRKAADPEVLAAWREEVLRIIADTGARQVQHITETTRETIRRLLIEAQAEGLGVDEAARRIRSHLHDITPSRATTIARTELNATATQAIHTGTTTAAEVLGVEMVKVWYHSGVNEARDTHLAVAASSQQNPIPVNQPFNVGATTMMHPGEWGAPPEEVINCRCTVLYEVKE